MKYIPVFTVILTSLALTLVILFRQGSKETVRQEYIQTTYGIPNVAIETENGFLRIEKSGNTYNIK